MHLSWWWIDRRVYEYFATNIGPLLGWRDPILVYQMGKVGSSTIRNSLFRCSDPTTKVVLASHEFFPPRERQMWRIIIDPEYREAVLAESESDRRLYAGLPLRERIGWRLRENLYTKKIYRSYVKRGHVRVITLVRDPVATNVSMFFQLLEHYLRFLGSRELPGVDSLCKLFLSEYNHFRPLVWFDAELKTTLGIDVYQHEFLMEEGYMRISNRNVDLVVLKAEIEDEAKSRIIADFLGLKELQLVRSNVAEDKSYAGIYIDFKQSIKIPQALLDKIYESRYARHFYSSREIEGFRKRWGAVPAHTRETARGAARNSKIRTD
jgi:hypothetical protein